MKVKHLLNGKFTAPTLPRVSAPRESLMKLYNSVSDNSVIFVSAPAGYGKTISTLLWLMRSKRETIWMGLDGYDNTPFIFYKLFCTGILSVQPKNKAMADIFMSPSFSSSPVEHTIRLLSEFIPDEKLYALVLDDVHLVTNRELLKSGLLVQKRLPLSFITFVLSRNVIAEDYTSIINGEKYAIITPDQLAFSPKEIQELFHVNSHPIALEEAEKVYSITDGWAIGVNALARSGYTEIEEQSGQILEGYIKKQIWDKWDEETQFFLLKNSIVDEIPADLCEKLTGRTDSREVLEKLYGDSFFISKLSEDMYSFHHLFLEFLRGQAPDSDIDTQTLYRIAAEYYLEQGEYFIARRYAVKSEDTDILLRIVCLLSQYRSACVDEFVSFSKLYSDEPYSEIICDQAPFLYATLMWENYLLGNSGRMEYYLDKIYQFLPVISRDYPQYLETVVMQITLDHRVPISMLIEQFAAYPPIVKLHDNQRGATLTHEMPFIHRSNRDYCELTDDVLLEHARDTLGLLLKDSAELMFSAIQAGFLLERNMHKDASDAVLQTKDLVRENTSDELRFSVFVLLAAAYYAAGNSKYTDILAETERFMDERGAHYLLPNFLAFKTKVLLLDGDRAAASEWIGHYFVTESEHLELYKIYQYFATAKAYLVLGQTEKAMDYILRLKKLGTDFNRLLDIAEAGVMQAVLEWAVGQKKEAQRTLEEVMILCQPYRFIRVIAIEGAAVLPILKRFNAKVKREGYHGPLEAQFLYETTLAALHQAKRHKGITAHIHVKPVKLSKRQAQILSLLANGCKYAEVAEDTGLTIHTVKSHASAAYSKLNVSNIMDAALKARELGLID